ncbi:hypothetical protein [Acinetobacter bereziniae]|uniref:hypothetical protein n=1 Tax=Acinetobacter bereziniae TaxID=106648 RepID=UPI0012507F7A|nr:hypothetical protein [Acinetobacter bereziniae]MBJ9903444.1 hypothetical protein [Acinetobacter bereziniae]MCU4319521.1 hypothetical protein [Acinetobacter bereziniae]MCU4599186.1 hypothetical protein [Acinetobacter bereziniae]MDV8153971.1 hypothetical protein [Acinetobacter bereziniae]
MKTITKITLLSASILSMGALTACQSNPGPKDDPEGRPMMHGGHHKMSPEQREEMKKMRAQHKEMRQQMQKACDGKAIGQTVQVKAGEQSIDGTCNIVFKADRKAMKEMKHDFRRDGEDRGRMMRHDGPRMKDMTEEQRAQIQQEFAQKRAERKAQWDAIQKSCAGQTDGKAIQVKIGDKTLAGQCVVKFQPDFKADRAMPTMPPKV